MAKLWGGRFDGKNEAWIDAFGASIPFDYQLAKQDIIGSLAHVKMLGATGIIMQKEASQISTGLQQLAEKAAKEELDFTIENE
ncbi:MAG: argininosuccinate lyase, partial [Enterococcus sp.]